MEDGESGFALLFPKITGVKIQKFQFFKDSKCKVFDESKLEEAGELIFSTNMSFLLSFCAYILCVCI